MTNFFKFPKHSLWPPVIFWSLLSVLLHAFYINTPFINLEYVFAHAAQSLLGPKIEKDLFTYWYNQANPLGYVWFSAFFHFLTGQPDGFWSYRLASLSGLVMILSAGAIFTSALKPGHLRGFHLWCALVTFSPLVWVFSGRATADVLPVGLLLLSFALAFKSKEKNLYGWLASVIFLLSILVKYHTLIFVTGFIYIFWVQNQCQFDSVWIKKTIRFLLLPLLGLVIYVWFIYDRYNFFLVPEYHSSLHKFQPAIFLKAFSLYAHYLAILLGPLAMVCVRGARKKKLVATLLGTGLGLWMSSLQSLGEMNYGAFDWLLQGPLMILVKVLGGILFCFILLDLFLEAGKNKNVIAGFLLTTCIPYILVCSATRPAQRYLVFMIPLIFYYLVFIKMRDRNFEKWGLAWGTVAIFFLINIFAVNYQVAQAQASNNMAQWLIKNELIENTHPGSIQSHSGQYFIPFLTIPKNHRVLERPGEVKEALHSERVVVFGRTLKTYYLE